MKRVSGPMFKWYDFWIGFFYDRDERMLYVCPLPTLLIKISLHRKEARRQVVKIERESERAAYYLNLADQFLEATR